MSAPYADVNDMQRALGPDGVRRFFDESHDRDHARRLVPVPAARPEQDAPQPRSTRLRLVNATSFAGKPIPERDWLVTGLIPARNVTELDGDGGTGKSLLALQLAVAVATGSPWIGRQVAKGKVIYVSAEDDVDELHIRLAAIVEDYGLGLEDLGNLEILPLAGEDAVLVTPPDLPGSPLELTPLFRQLIADIQAQRPALVVLDTRADLFGGNEVDRLQVRQFITALRGVAMRANTAFLLLAHPSLAGMQSGRGGSGSTGWRNSVRSALLFTRVIDKESGTEADTDVRELLSKKSNYGRTGERIMLRWQRGVFAPDGGNDGASWLDKKAGDAKADELFLKLTARFASQGRTLSDKPGSNYAPNLFAQQPDAKGYTKRAFIAAMNRLFNAGKIRTEIIGSGKHAKVSLSIVSHGGSDAE